MKKVFILCICLVFMIVSTGCSRKTEYTTNNADEEVQNVNEDTKVKKKELSESEKLEKYNVYSELNEFLAYKFGNVIEGYYEEFKYQENFQPLKKKEQIGNSFGMSDGYDKGLLSIKQYADSGESDLDVTVQKIMPVVIELKKEFGEMGAYVKAKGFMDDDFAKAKEYHSKIYSLTNEYYTLYNELYSQLKVMNDEYNTKLLNESESKGEYARYYALDIIIKAQNIENYLKDYKGMNILNIDIETFKREYYEPFSKDVEEGLKYLKDKEELKKERYENLTNNNIDIVDNYVEAIVELKGAATEVIERVQKQTRENDFISSSRFFLSNHNGTGEKFDKELGEAIDLYNNFKSIPNVNQQMIIYYENQN